MKLFLFLLPHFVAGQTGTTCANPVCENPTKYGFKEIERTNFDCDPLPSPSTWSSSETSMCSQLFKTSGNAGQSCCSNKTLAEISTTIKVATEYLKKETKLMVTEAKQYFTSQFKEAMEAICKAAGCPDSLMQALEKYETDLETQLANLAKAQQTCSDQMLNYFEGMLCFVCDVDWNKYVQENTLSIAQSSCDQIFSACGPVYDSVKTINALTTRVALECLDILLQSKFKVNPDLIKNKFTNGFPDMCGGLSGKMDNCKNYTCHSLLNGINLPDGMFSNWSPQLNEGAQINSYTTNGGYDPVSIGCNANNNCISAPTPAPTPNDGGIAVAVVLVILCLAGLGVGGYFVWKKFKPFSTDANNKSFQEGQTRYGSSRSEHTTL